MTSAEYLKALKVVMGKLGFTHEESDCHDHTFHNRRQHRMVTVSFDGKKIKGTFSVIDRVRAKAFRFHNSKELSRLIGWVSTMDSSRA